jgi:hypothetical protein
LPLDRIKQVVDTAWPLLVEMIRREAAKPLKARIADLEGEMQCTKYCCSDMMAKNHHLYQDVQELEDDLDDTKRECASLCKRAQGSHNQDPDEEPPSKRTKGKGRVVPTTTSSQLLPGASQATPMVIDQPLQLSREYVEISSS